MLGCVRSVAAAVCLLAFVAGCGSAKPVATLTVAGTWATVAAAPASLTEVAVAVHHGRIWVAGGLRTDGTGSDEVFVFDPAAGKWTSGPTLPEPIHHSALVSTPDGLVLVGGYLGNELNVITDAVRRLDDGATAWTDGVKLPDFRAAGGAAVRRHADRLRRRGQARGRRQRGLRARERRDVMDGDRPPADRPRAPGRDDGRCRAHVRARRPGRRPRQQPRRRRRHRGPATVRSRRSARCPRNAAASRPSGGRPSAPASPAANRPAARTRRSNASPSTVRSRDSPTWVSRAMGSARPWSDGTAYVVLGGRQPGLFTSDVTESLRLP